MMAHFTIILTTRMIILMVYFRPADTCLLKDGILLSEGNKSLPGMRDLVDRVGEHI